MKTLRGVLVATMMVLASGNAMADGVVVKGNVYGGGNLAEVQGSSAVNMSAGAVDENVFGGGNLAAVKGNVTVNISGGTITKDVYGGGALADTNIGNVTNYGEENETIASTSTNITAVNLTGGTIDRNVYGGGLGRIADTENNVAAVEAKVYGDVTVTLNNNSGTCQVNGSVFGCNNENGTPKGDVVVNVYGTSLHNTDGSVKDKPTKFGDYTKVIDTDTDDNTDDLAHHTFELVGVYGGGNLAAYAPATGKGSTVNIYGCDKSNIKEVYGGGSAADVPEATVNVYGSHEIGFVYAGGNGTSSAANVNGNATTTIHGGTIYRVFAGSNTAGDITGTSTLSIAELANTDANYCVLKVGDVFSYGNLATMTGTSVLNLGCLDNKIGALYGGAMNANIGSADSPRNIVLNINGGKYHQVFGGNKSGGIINGSIIVNIEKTSDCTLEIDELYGCGNAAAYTTANSTTTPYDDPEINIISCTSIGSVYGGGWGPAAVVTGNPKVNINMLLGTGQTTDLGTIGNVYGGGYGADVVGNSEVNIGTASQVKIPSQTTDENNPHMENVVGAKITGDVFGGGYGETTNVSGNVTVNVGRVADSNNNKLTIGGDVYGGSAKGTVNTDENNTTQVNLCNGIITGNVYGGGLGVAAVAGVGTDPNDPDYVAPVAEIPAIVKGNVIVKLNENDDNYCQVNGSIFGCNNTAGSPEGHVTVHVYKTFKTGNNKDLTKTTLDQRWSGDATYDMNAVYGGGNKADYVPTSETDYAEVIIDGCNETSIKEVYGGGYGAAVPATQVKILGAYLINEVFGGGYGAGNNNPGANVGYYTYTDEADKTAYTVGNGKAQVKLYGGMVHTAYGGSNTKGNIRGASSAGKATDIAVTCSLQVKNIYGAGKNADQDGGTDVVIGCIPGLENVYGGANAANIKGGVNLFITGGDFVNVFGGNDTKGTIQGPIKVYIEEDCEPINIQNLYLGGKNASYSVYGYYDDNGTLKPRTSATDLNPVAEGTIPPDATTNQYEDPQLFATKFTSIGNVYGGGYGSGAVMYGNPTVNINEVKKKFADGIGTIGNVYGGGDAANVEGNTTVNIGTTDYALLKYIVDGETDVTGYYTLSGEGTTESPYEYIVVTPVEPATTVKAQVGTDYYMPVLGANITGNVYGGGNLADVTGNTQVNICAKEVMVSENKEWQSVDEGTSKVIINGDVFGAGKGSDTNAMSALVKGNSFVYMGGGWVKSTVYGGGELASVGDFTYDANNVITACGENSGTASVNIFGGKVGPTTLTMPMFDGHVFGAGKGISGANDLYPKLNFVENTSVTISGTAFVKGSVYGGSENGHVRGNTNVMISGGQIGCGRDLADETKDLDRVYTTDEWDYTKTQSLPECPSWKFGQAANAADRYAPYDPYAGSVGYDSKGGRTIGDDGHTFYGNVFGGGSGYFPYAAGQWLMSAGSVGGNTTVTITGGHILTNIYGGNELTNVEGTSTVNFGGNATLGVPRTLDEIAAHPLTCYLFGAGKGDQRVLFNKDTNVGNAVVNITGGWIYGSVFGGGEDGHVNGNVTMNISDDTNETNHVSTKIGTWGTSYVDGNVFGGGRGFGGDAYTAGNIAGNVTMTISGGTMLGSVYGGGRLGSVGYSLENEYLDNSTTLNPNYGKMQDGDSHGHVTIDISGGTIGNNIEYAYEPTDKANMPKTLFGSDNRLLHTKGGNVFAGGMGRRENLNGAVISIDNDGIDWHKLGNVKSTKLTISGTAWIKGNVFGGGELGAVTGNHQVFEGTTPVKDANNNDIYASTEIIINGGTIGTMLQSGVDPKDVTSETTGSGDSRYTFGSVYGGSYGTEVDVMGTPYTTDVTKFAAFVSGNTYIKMTTGKVRASVYGGGEMACVGGNTYVNVSGGEIGINEVRSADTDNGKKDYVLFGSWKMGNVYGAGKGSANAVYSGLVKGNTYVNISGTPGIYHNVYGGGAYGSVGDITLYSASENGEFTPVGAPKSWAENTGTATVTITGTPTIGINGWDNGMVSGSSRGDVGTPVDGVDPNDRLAWVNDAKVTIGTPSATTGPSIKGSLYGGGENGHNGGNAEVNLYSGTIGVAKNDAKWGSLPIESRGNVYGAGCGTDTYKGTDNAYHHNRNAGFVLGETKVNVNGGTVYNSVYGGGSMGSVGVKNTVTIGGGTIEGSVYGGSKGDLSEQTCGHAKTTEVTMAGGTVKHDVYGGGEAGIVEQGVVVNVTGGTVEQDVYGGGALADTNTDNWNETAWAVGKTSASNTTIVNVLGGSMRDVYGGGLGNATTPAYVYGDTKVNLNGLENGDYVEAAHQNYVQQIAATATNVAHYELKTTGSGTETAYSKGAVVNRVFGGNNLNGTPKGNTTVHVFATQAKNQETIKAKNALHTDLETGATTTYDVVAVYGGGNEASYIPVYDATTKVTAFKTQVIIEGCEYTSIKTVYGGGNAAAVPETNVEIKSAYEIENVYGGGNGKDKKSDGSDNPGADVGTPDHDTSTYGTGNVNTLLEGGRIHEAYGGSNQKGVIKGSLNQTSNPDASDCALVISKVVGAGKYADIDGDVNMILSCQPESKIDLLFAGADEANVNGNISLTITNGNFGKVFGGNNLGGAVKGKIVVNVEETGCRPINIEELYLGGNQAAYSIYGYYESDEIQTATGKKILKPRESATDSRLPVKPDGTNYASIGDFTNYGQPILNVISCTHIGKVFGGGYGAGAKMYADPTVNINMIPGAYAAQIDRDKDGTADNIVHRLGTIGEVYGGGDAADVIGNATVNIGTEPTAYLNTEPIYRRTDAATPLTPNAQGKYEQPVEGAFIVGNIFGGGNQANVEGNTEVNIGTCTYGEGFEGVSVNCLKNIAEHPDNEEKTGMVFGGGNAADVTGNTVVNIAGGYVENRIYGGGNLGSVGTITERETPSYHTHTTGTCIQKPKTWKEGTGKCTVTISGGKLGRDNMTMPDDFGYVFGASRGEVKDTAQAANIDLPFMTYVKETDVTISGTAFILGGVYGGSENGHVRGDTWVKIQENCQIGAGFNTTTNLSLARYDNDSFINPATTPVTADNALATCAAFPYDVATTGKPYDPYHGTAGYDSKGGATAAEANDGHTFYGNVFGGGSGFFPYAAGKWLRSAGLVEGNTRVDIEGGHILSNVYGGNEQTDVYGTCTINMSGGTIGVPRTKEQIQGHPVIGNLFGAGKGDKRVLFNTWTNVGNTSVNVTGGIVYGSVFGGGEDGHVLGNATTNIEEDNTNNKTITIGSTGESTADGNVFGGGRGSETALTAGVVGGNVSLTIKSGKILGNVYGGGRLASVGTNFTAPTDENYGKLQSPDTNHGNITVNIDGGTIGIANSETGVNGNIYGGSKGVDGKFDLGIVRSTTINMTGGTAYASVHGGGELAQVVGTHSTDDGKALGTEINISGGTIGKSGKGGATWGNVYGGGKGNTTNVAAGLIKTNTFVKISGTSESPVIHHNIYGGGAYGSVGTFTYDANNVISEYTSGGKAYITILGGKIGKDGKENGMIFGSSRGDVGGIGEIHDKLAWVYDTEVTIGGGETTPQIVGSVYGGGENGHNYHDAVVNVHSGTIGIASGEPITSNNGTPDDTSDDITYNGAEYPYRGNVYGGGCGTDKYYSDPSLITGTHTANDGEGDQYNPLAGIVYGNATVNITGGTVVRNVYGAGAMGSVGKTNTDGSFTGGQTTINISGGAIGVSGTVGDGNVFGAARGALDAPENNFALVNGNTNVSITGGTLYGNVYGGGELGYVGKFTSVTDATTGSKTYTWPEGSGTCNVTIDGATATVKGYVFGAGKGSAETFECEPAMVYKTNVIISKGTVDHNVYGGGQLGRVDNNTTVTIGTPSGTDEFEIKGNVFGAGAGVATHGYSALVRGDATVTVQGKAKVAGSVYGGGETASVGKFHVVNSLPKEPLSGGTCTVTIQDDAQIGTSGSGAVYGACKGVEPDYANNAGHWKSDNQSYAFDNEAEYLSFLKTLALTSHTVVTIDGKASVNGSVYGGGQRGITLGHVNVDMKGGTVSKDVYGGGALADTNTGNATGYGTNTETLNSTSTYTTTVNLTGGTIGGDAYGGGLGRLGKETVAAQGTPGEEGYVPAQAAISAVEAKVYGDVVVNLGKAKDDGTADLTASATAFNVTLYNDAGHTDVVKSGRIFGCNNLNGSPQGNVTVTVNKTVAGNTTRTAEANLQNKDVAHTYELADVYGGGNLADYASKSGQVKVIINSCDVSVQEVYGGGNAAAVPATDVEVRGAYEIAQVFGGGNGEDDYYLNDKWNVNPGANIGGNANTLLTGGYIHEAYGGSNSKGTISGNINISKGSGGRCDLNVVELYGAGKDADVEGDLIMVMGCSETRTEAVYGCSMNANVKGNVELTITSGEYGKVFGGNNKSGAIFGHIIVNIEEDGCSPIIIDELYGCGNDAAYSTYGYYQDGTIEGTDGKPKYVARTANDTHEAVTFEGKPHTIPPYADPEVNIISCTSIGKVFGGGLGEHATVYGNPKVNINMIKGAWAGKTYGTGASAVAVPDKLGAIGDVFGGGNAADVVGNDTVNIGMVEKVRYHLSADASGNYTMSDEYNVEGANITGNVFGGGNEADVSGNTYVNICGTQIADSNSENGYTDTAVDHSGTAGFNVSIGNTVYGGGNAAHVLGNTFVTMADGYVFNGIFGGGLAGSVGTLTRDPNATDWDHDPNHDGTCLGKPTACEDGTGTCYVVVSGGQIGPVEVATQGMNRTAADGGPVPQGWVWGAGCGLVEDPATHPDTHFRAYVNNTDVTIKDKAFILESIIGGGEFGRVLGNTLVKVKGGQIGVGYNQTETVNGVLKPKRYTDDQFVDPTTTTITTGLATCSHFPFGKEVEGKKVYECYDPYADAYKAATGSYLYPGGVTDGASDGKTWIGCVFGGGSGYIPYVNRDASNLVTDYDWVSSAGWVEGNTEVRISGGHILSNVYGGNEYTDVKGTSKVIMTGGTVGVPRTQAQIEALPMSGYIYGAGKGDERVHFNTATNVGHTEVEISGGIVYGSVYGGGEDGHVLGDAKVTIKDGAKIGTCGTSYFDGHVFGGGRGFSGVAQTAGTVGGNVTLDIKGGKMLGSIYGGGRLASVGTQFTAPDNDNYGNFKEDEGTNKYGHVTVNISGGTIGNSAATGDGAKYSGNVFGGSMGRLDLLDGTRNPIWPKMAQVKTATVNISGTIDGTTIMRTVFGGGELGTVRDDASVTISGGTIRRDVYGGGYGSLDMNHTIFSVKEPNSTNTGYESHTYAFTPMQFAGCVGKSTTVNVSGGYIRKSVYGGGEMASVGVIDYRAKETTSEPAADKVKIGPIDGKTYYYENIVKHGDETKEFALSWPYEFKYVDGFEGATHVNITGGRLGLKDSDKDDSLTDNGDVYGAGKGMAGDYKDYLFCANVGSTDVKIAYGSTPTAYSADGDLIAGAAYGGGEDGHVMGDTKLTISGGLINHSVYGAGSGKGKFKATLKKIGKEENYEANIYSITAGKVFGNSTVEMSGGYVVRNIYGGGNMGSVGKGNYAGGADDYSTAGYGEKVDGNLWDGSNKFSTAFLNSGKCTVKITGGTIGYIASDPSSSMYPWNSTASLPYGNVFGGCRGESAPNISETPRYLYSPEFFVGYANETEVTIEGANTKILGSVYGGGMDGHVRRDASVTINGGEIGLPYTDANKTLLKTEDINNIQWLARGNVYGSGSGIGTYKYDFDYDGKYTSTVTYNGKQTKEEDFSTSAGSVTRFTKVEIKGGNIYRNVYGGGSLSSIGAPKIGQTYNLYSKDDASHSTEVGKQTLNEVIISGGQIGEATGVAVNYGGHMFGGSRGDASLDNSMFSTSMFTKVNIGGGQVLGSVFGGGEVGIVKGSVAVNVTGGEVAKDIYGGGALANTNTENWNPTGGTDGKGGWAAGQVTDGKTTYSTTVNLLGGTVDDVFGGSLGQRVGDVTGGTKDIEAFVYGDVNVNLNGLEASDYVATAHGSFVTGLDKDANNAFTSYRANDGCIVKGEVYGCNNINGTPKGHAKVHVFKTKAKDGQAADDYDVANVFGGGNNADYVPADTKQATEVIIEGCDLTSIQQVYGGGNAAATPGTSVLVKGTKIIYEVFGGGNGEAEGTKAHVGKKTADDSDYDLGEGKAEVQLMAGNVTYVYGGSNTHGDIRGGSYVTNVTKDNSLGCCEKLNVKEIFAGGKNADMIGGAKIVMGCTNSEDWVEEIYAGAKAANVGGDVSLTLTSGKFGRVFGGNKDSGVLDGSITVNIEENAKCGIPLIIGELYGGGNKAAYSIYGYNADGTVKTSGENPKPSPVVNVRAFTSIGNIFGGGYGSAAEMHGSPTININVVNNNRTTGSTISTAITKTFEEGTENEYTVTIPTHEDRKIGAINNVYGGGNAAKVWGDTNVNIGTEAKQKLVKLDDTGNPLYTDAEKTIPQTEEMDVVGADIRGNVYGGGNAAEVTGNTNVVIGKDGTAATQ